MPARQALALPQKKWGPASLPAPTAPSEGSAGVRNLVDRTRRPADPLSILAHQLRRRFPSDRSLLAEEPDRPTRPCDPEGLPVFRSVRPAREPKPSVKTVRCSAALLGSTTLASRFASSRSEDRWKPRRARGRSTLPAPLPGWPRFRSRGSFGIACRRRSDLWSPAAPACRCRLLGRPGPPSRSPEHHAPLVRVAKAKNAGRSLWITGKSVTTIGTLAHSALEAPIHRACG